MISSPALSTLQNALRKAHVNSTCIGCSACVSISPEVFELDQDGMSHVRACSSYENKDVDDAISACPVNAISWQTMDESGNYTNGIIEHKDV